MTALSIHIPEKLAKASQKVAQELGISRTELIRQALIHELEHFYAERERKAMANCFSAMRNHPSYMKIVNELDAGLDDEKLPDDGEEWWTGKK